MLILFGSETGYAQETAERIKREAKQRHFQVNICAMDSYDVTLLPNETLAVFVCSVTGQGDEPTNMRKFWRFLLKKSLPLDSLSGMHFGVFGQGDSSYEKYEFLMRFNWPAKKLYKRLIQLGAQPLLKRGDGDDQHYLGVDGALDPWLTELWENVLKLYPLAPGLSIIPDNILPPSTFNFSIIDSPLETFRYLKGKHLGCVKSNIRITSQEHFQDVRHIIIESEHIDYQAGDSIVIYPQNSPERVDRALSQIDFGIDPDVPIQFTQQDEKEHIPEFLQRPISLRVLFQHHLDLFGRPKRYFFQLLSFFATSDQHAEKLAAFATAEGQDELYAYCNRPRRNYVEVLEDFNSVRIPVRYIPDLFPQMRPRYFSIASPPSTKSVELLVAIVKYKTSLKAERIGVCTSWMSKWKEGDVFGFEIAPGTFKVPANNTPLICIGPGTGVAPMRSILRERAAHNSKPSILFFGCRKEKSDFYFQDEWIKLEKEKSLKIIPAFSRDFEQKVYVQDKIMEYHDLVWNAIKDGSYILLSGY